MHRFEGGCGTRQLICVVEDNGPGFADEAPRSGAFGLRAVRRRLELKWPGARSLRLESSTRAPTRSSISPSLTEVAMSR